jgi:thiamine biosynthesis protein ThiS
VNEVVVNGERRAIGSGVTVRGLLAELGLDPAHVAVERNREIVPRADFEHTTLQPEDTLEIVTFVGGG